MDSLYTVKQFNDLVNTVLHEAVGVVSVTGEVSGYQVRQGKWVTFTLKDTESVLECFLPKFRMDLPLADGTEVVVTGTPRVYVPYGKYSFTVQSVQLKGEGALKKAFDELKAKLQTEGLFEAVHKRPLPRFPETIGIITSGEGAAINDIRKVINRRWGGLTLYLTPVLVQGKNAPDELVQAIHYFNEQHPVDVIIFGRGGGSLEDLQAFNSERVARAIFSSRIPIVAGIGHEHNTSIADLVADLRAATPSNAAELAVPDRTTITAEIALLRQRATLGITQRLNQQRHEVRHHAQTLHLFISGRLGEIRLLMQRLHQHATQRIQAIQLQQGQIKQLQQRATLLFGTKLHQAIERQTQQATLLAALNPKAILKRGYSITYHAVTLKPITQLAQLPNGGKIRTQVSDGVFESVVASQLTVAPMAIPPLTKPLKPESTSETQSSLF